MLPPKKLGMHRVDGFKEFFCCFFPPVFLGNDPNAVSFFARASHFLGLQHLGGIFGIWKFMHKTHRGIVEMVTKSRLTWDIFDGAIFFLLLAMMFFFP